MKIGMLFDIRINRDVEHLRNDVRTTIYFIYILDSAAVEATRRGSLRLAPINPFYPWYGHVRVSTRWTVVNIMVMSVKQHKEYCKSDFSLVFVSPIDRFTFLAAYFLILLLN